MFEFHFIINMYTLTLKGVCPPPPKILVIFIQNCAILGNSNGYIFLDIMPQKEGRLPIYLNRDVQYEYNYSDINPLIDCMCRYSK